MVASRETMSFLLHASVLLEVSDDDEPGIRVGSAAALPDHPAVGRGLAVLSADGAQLVQAWPAAAATRPRPAQAPVGCGGGARRAGAIAGGRPTFRAAG